MKFRFPVVALLIVNQALPVAAFAQQRQRPPGAPTTGHAVPRNPEPQQPQPPQAPAQQQPQTNPVDDARKAGHMAALPWGDKEGKERGPAEGNRTGYREGHQQGFDRCEAEERHKAYDQGYHLGHNEGGRAGYNEGTASGQVDGQRDGITAGNSAGTAAADRDANAAATPAGTAAGRSEADQSDADVKGTKDGTAAGDAQARQDAVRIDYPAGRTAYRNERYAAPYADGGAFNQKTPVEQTEHEALPPPPPNNNPDFRYFSSVPAAPTYPTQDETSAYNQGARAGYTSGFTVAYTKAFDDAAAAARPQGDRDGCREARNNNYSGEFRRGRDDGYQRGYADAFAQARKVAYDANYRAYYDTTYNSAYRDNYDAYYSAHYEAARQAAYQARYNERYNAAFAKAKKAKYDEVYPGYAATQREQGRKDEAQDFANRPVRVISATVKETIQNGLYEPGEALRVQVVLRNFSASPIPASAVKLSVVARSQGGSTISIGKEVLVKELKGNSQTVVNEALEFTMNEDAVNRVKEFALQATYLERDGGSADLNVITRWMAETGLAEAPRLPEGLPGQIRVDVRNKAEIPLFRGAQAKLASVKDVLDVPEKTATSVLDTVSPGATETSAFPVVLRANGDTVNLPIAVTVNNAWKRRVGQFSTVEQVATTNDYKIDASDLTALRTAGVTRVTYTIRNISSRLTSKSLQLKVTVVGDNAANFKVLGPNPQYLKPVDQNEETSFVVPILSNVANGGGLLQLEVKESDRDVVTRQTRF